MVTGETDHNAFDGSLLLGWDGERLHWVAVSPNGKVIDHGREEELGALSELSARFSGAQVVRVSMLRPVCSLMPTAVATGVEPHVLALQHGPKTDAFTSRTFQSERLGEGMSLIESGHWVDDDVFLSAFPMAQWASATLGAIEAGLQESRNNEWDATVRIDVGGKRALMMHFQDDALRWCSVTEDVGGDGILYHVVNALHRDGVELDNARCKVVFSGEVEERVVEQFQRFFAAVERSGDEELGSSALLMHAHG